jgi:hypothetical protein
MSAVLILSPEKHGLSGIWFRRYAVVRNRRCSFGAIHRIRSGTGDRRLYLGDPAYRH